MRCRRVWLDGRVVPEVTIDVDPAGRITVVRPARAGDGPWVDGLVVPGLVQAHTHLELSRRAGRVPGGGGFRAWGGALVRTPDDPSLPDGAAQARALAALGAAVVHDVSNGGHTGPWLAAAGIDGAVQHEILGMDPSQEPAARAVIDRGARWLTRGVVVRPAAHALLSTRPALVRDALAVPAAGVPSTLHVGESAEEAAFLRDGSGPIARWLDALGRRWRDLPPAGCDAIALLDRLGVLGPGVLLVHGIHLRPDALRRAARSGAALVTCPRSNLTIEGSLPDLRTWLAAGGRLALGTDSLASSPDLDVLGEIPVLARAFPEIPAGVWLDAATAGGAAAAWPGRGRGRIAVGQAPGLLVLDAGTPADLTRSAPDRAWGVRPGPAGRYAPPTEGRPTLW